MAAEAITPGQRSPCALVPSAADLKFAPPKQRSRDKVEIGDDSIETKSVGLGDCYFYPHHDAAQPVPTTRDASDEASNPAPVTQDFR